MNFLLFGGIFALCFVSINSSGKDDFGITKRDIVVRQDDTLSITCIWNRLEPAMKWRCPDYVEDQRTEPVFQERFSILDRSNKTHKISELTLRSIQQKEMGQYKCISLFKDNRIGTKLFNVFDNTSLVFLDDQYLENESTVKEYKPKTGEFVTVTCKAAHPDVIIQIKRKHNGVFNVTLAEWKNRTLDELTSWVPQVKIDDTGEYECVGSMNNVSTHVLFNIVVSGVEASRLGGPGDPLKGSNVTLLCRSLKVTNWEMIQENNTSRISNHQPPVGMYVELINESTDFFPIIANRLTIVNVSMGMSVSCGNEEQPKEKSQFLQQDDEEYYYDTQTRTDPIPFRVIGDYMLIYSTVNELVNLTNTADENDTIPSLKDEEGNVELNQSTEERNVQHVRGETESVGTNDCCKTNTTSSVKLEDGKSSSGYTTPRLSTVAFGCIFLAFIIV